MTSSHANLVQWNPDFSSFQGKRKLVQKICRRVRDFSVRLTRGQRLLDRVIGRFEKLSVREIEIRLYYKRKCSHKKRMQLKGVARFCSGGGGGHTGSYRGYSPDCHLATPLQLLQGWFDSSTLVFWNTSMAVLTSCENAP